ncbi:hypothetical protein ABMA27_012925 [Loxostege sticticalis]|uniref:FP protein C-terminal domain-containing protein n=1 Tax=Loxostege sticticalis TaxID=481309 RepID=A0ABR3H0L6_LOXSC
MFTSKCASCTEIVGDGPECAICKKRFHFACGGISERGFTRLGSGRATWMCTTCRDVSQADSPDLQVSSMDVAPVNTPGSSKFSSGLPLEMRTSSTSTPKQSTIGEDKQGQFMALLSELSSKITNMQAEMKIIRVIQKDLQQVKSDIAVLNTTINARLDQISTRVDDIETRVSVVEGLKTEVDELKVQVRAILEEGYKNDQWVRRSNIQINGIPQKSGENLITIIKILAERSGFPLQPNSDIDFVTRVAVKNDVEGKKSKPIILKMQSRYKKDDFLASLRKLKDIKASDIGFTGVPGRIYFNDHLSSRNKNLFQQAKQKAKEKCYAYCWVRNCTIMVRKTDKSPVLHITSQDALKKIV